MGVFLKEVRTEFYEHGSLASTSMCVVRVDVTGMYRRTQFRTEEDLVKYVYANAREAVCQYFNKGLRFPDIVIKVENCRAFSISNDLMKFEVDVKVECSSEPIRASVLPVEDVGLFAGQIHPSYMLPVDKDFELPKKEEDSSLVIERKKAPWYE